MYIIKAERVSEIYISSLEPITIIIINFHRIWNLFKLNCIFLVKKTISHPLSSLYLTFFEVCSLLAALYVY